jgi:hypothetical protein
MGKYSVSSIQGGARLVSGHDPAVGMTLIKEIRIDDRTGGLDVIQVMRNTSEQNSRSVSGTAPSAAAAGSRSSR